MSDDATGQIIPPNIRRMPDGRLVLVGGNHNVQTMFAADGTGADPAAVAVFLANHAARGMVGAPSVASDMGSGSSPTRSSLPRAFRREASPRCWSAPCPRRCGPRASTIRCR